MAKKAKAAFERFRLLTKKLVNVPKNEADKVDRTKKAQRS